MFLKNGVVFKDGCFEEVDDVILCTGYEFNLSFLDESCELNATTRHVVPVYQHMVNIRKPSMMILGLATPSITRILDAQAEYAVALIAGKFQLPSQADMMQSWLKHVTALYAEGRKIDDANLLFDDMDQYFANIAKEAGITRVAPVLTIIRDYDANYRLEDLLNYRDFNYEVLDQYNYKRWYEPSNRSCDINI
ncbi:senecionine N-oxygenase-like [Choristoneura fumiferana]|uniref:senecionine N-oxygenase-like n=1 Tax=Choristoneura fumiferana TaxID=7141 RepID=UPI003D15BA1F